MLAGNIGGIITIPGDNETQIYYTISGVLYRNIKITKYGKYKVFILQNTKNTILVIWRLILMETKVTTIRVNEEILDQLKIQAVKEKVTQTELINRYIVKGLRNDGVEI